jgi:Tol biopolymer transport system component/DNA-binding winged helix-turn-helix (wHTH) protein
MQSTIPSQSRITFGLYEVDLQAGELWRSGYRVKLQSQPFKVLTVLLERPGEVVTREELQRRLWGSNTIVDFDHSLATAINKIREALRDSAENPRFVETLARRGYRFIAPVHHPGEEERSAASAPSKIRDDASDELLAGTVLEAGPRPVQIEVAGAPKTSDGRQAAIEIAPVAAAEPAPAPAFLGTAAVSVQVVAPAVPGRAGVPSWVWLGLLAVVGVALGSVGYLAGERHAGTVPPHITQLTHSGHLALDMDVTENLMASATDGYRLFVPVVDGGRSGIATVPVSGGSPVLFSVPEEVASPMLGDVSPDGTQLLLRNHLSPESEQPLWVVPASGGSALRVSRVLAHDATWMPDGKSILYAAGNDLYLTQLAEGTPQLYASLPGRAFWLRWNPSGKLLRFTIVDPIAHTKSLWELSPADRKPRQILKGFMDSPMESSGVWTADGKWFVFESSKGGNTDLWKLAADSTDNPVRVTDGPLQFQSPLPAREGNTLYMIGVDNRSQLVRLTSGGALVPERGFLASALRVDFSRDRKSAAWTDSMGHLWRSAADGSARLQLTPDSLNVFMARWSPDGSKLALMARAPGRAWQIYLVDADGGEVQPLLRESRNAADPSWSPDGKMIAFGRVNDPFGKENAARKIEVLHLDTGTVDEVPQSEGLFSPRWSPDGRYIAALSLDQRQVKLFNVATRQWSTLPVHSGADPVWSPDSRYLYLHESLDPAQPIDRVAVPGGPVQPLIRLNDSPQGGAESYVFAGLTADNEPLIVEQTFTGNLYSLQLK